MPLILGAQSAVATGYTIDNSCRFNLQDDASMEWTQSIEGNRDAWTFSCWLKRGEIPTGDGGDQLFSSSYQNNDNNSLMSIVNDGHLQWDERNNDDSTLVGEKSTTQLLRDPASWYHICYIWDSANVTSTDRMQIWVNGVRVTDFASSTDPGSDQNAGRGKAGATVTISRWGAPGSGEQMDGYIAEVIFLDGVVASPVDTLGQFNEDSPSIWEPIDPSGLTFGDEGYWLDFKDSADLGADVSGNGNDFTPANLAAVDQCTDTPNNNFATGISILRQGYPGSITISEGNTKIVDSGSDTTGLMSTLGVTAGKWYVEFMRDSGTNSYIGVCGASQMNEAAYNNELGVNSLAIGLAADGDILVNNSSSTFAASYAAGDVISVALDMDNDKVYFAKDGAWATGSGAWGSTTFDAAVGAQAVNTGDDTYVFGCSVNTSGTSVNFGNPNYVLTSAVADENGYGSFEYAPPSGYLALCTKNLGSSGG